MCLSFPAAASALIFAGEDVMQVEILKCHGSGNDFPLIDARGTTLTDAQWSVVARALADRSGLVGGDGLLLLEKDPKWMFCRCGC